MDGGRGWVRGRGRVDHLQYSKLGDGERTGSASLGLLDGEGFRIDGSVLGGWRRAYSRWVRVGDGEGFRVGGLWLVWRGV